MNGRPRKPTRIKDLAGTSRKDRSNSNEPKPEPFVGAPPDYLSGSALDEWERITPELEALGIVSALDTQVLVAYCTASGEFVDALKEWQVKGMPMTTLSSNGIEMVHPLLTIIGQRRDQMRKMANELGATPASRSKVSANPKPTEAKTGKERFFG